MKKLALLIGLLVVPALFLTSCDRGDDPSDPTAISTPAFTLMADYMVQNNLDINNILTNTDGEKFVKAPPATADLVDGFLSKYYIMDIRNSTDFLAAHVNGAKNVAFADILTDAANATKPILVVCYTGQTACYATGLLRMYGYAHTFALKWGMSGWNSNNATPWNNSIGNPAQGHANWTNTGAPTNIVYEAPTITSLSTNGETILKERVEAIVTLGFQGVNGTDVIANPGNYFINNYFSETDYLGFGHINGAYRINPLKLSDDSYLGLNPANNAKVVTYCYTGQTSAVITACLRVLGYDAYSLKFGMNGLYNSNPVWTSNKWSASVSKDFPTVSN
ncbi:rhodanese-like domain-containing protein [Flavivirga spongiicola]|uniref:Rhodanese-like domain-containing protein n=1 Tax=Flavivirga spongiicola TaxID=421621 RepID=A0ABU7Y1P5_9FLAO|nr:rhodanese-like domain-containing protein [Flavivirga sp. MEBiC05379]MDO5981049.1 rhodanese-like domain-containing protein [Flavivirga sp. MEBiC05379]